MATNNCQIINGYVVPPLNNDNSGFSKWGFATKYGKEYFIKELITPVYPVDRSVMSDELFEQRRAECAKYENRFRQFYATINNASCGNLVRINEFFRNGSRYYLVTEKISGASMPLEALAALPTDKKLLLLKTVANCFFKLHSSGIVHFDVKPANILVKATVSGNYTAKLIDFDAGFFLGEDIENSELGGDLTYLAPETFLGIYGEDVRINEKADIFALGLVFHQYCYAKLPDFNHSEYEYPYEAILDESELVLEKGTMPDEVNEIIKSMLDIDPNKRPSAGDIFTKLNEITGTVISLEAPPVQLHGFTTTYGTSQGGAVSGSRLRSTMKSATSTGYPASGMTTSGPSISPPVTSPTAATPTAGTATTSPWFSSAGDL